MEFLDTDLCKTFKIMWSRASQVSFPKENVENRNCLAYFFKWQLYWGIIYTPWNSPFKVYIGFSIFTELCNHHRSLILGHFHHSLKKAPHPTTTSLQSSVPRQPPLYSLFCGFAYSRRFVSVGNRWSLVCSFFHSAWSCQGSSRVLHAPVLLSKSYCQYF